MKGVLFAERALNDMLEIELYSYKWGVEAADKYLASINQKIKLISENNYIGIRQEQLNEAVRRLPVREHIIFYKIEKDDIRILRILHSSVDAEAEDKAKTLMEKEKATYLAPQIKTSAKK